MQNGTEIKSVLVQQTCEILLCNDLHFEVNLHCQAKSRTSRLRAAGNVEQKPLETESGLHDET